MKYAEMVVTPRLLRKPQAEQYVGGQQNLKRLRKAGWVKPLIQHSSNTSFDVKALNAAIDRANLDGWPEEKK
jgi:hypothetical protein